MRVTAPGDDGVCGLADHYLVRRSSAPITADNWFAATQVAVKPASGAAGTDESLVVSPLTTNYFYAVRAVDEAGNMGALSNVVFIAGTDQDSDGVRDVDEQNCGSDPVNIASRPERLDGPFAGVDDNGNGQVDEPLPAGASAYDCDGDGYTGATESNLYVSAGTTSDQDPCGITGWPSDFVSGGAINSTNRITITDLTSFLAPLRRLNTNPGDNAYNARWDLSTGAGLFPWVINIQDMTSIIAATTGRPPMLFAVRAYNGPACPWPP
ncbi:MAG: hypothetical protein E6J42_04860 [Chloroflexi bacterium]|nr:MAG: hypothetical protein E6J42_04860 [Chloroflexota bacterium]